MKILNTQDYIKEKYQIKPLTKERLKKIKTYDHIYVASNDNMYDLVYEAIEKYGNNVDLNFINTSNVTYMVGLFAETCFNGDISQWDVSNVKDMGHMFENSQFNGDISQWDVSKVENMDSMFAYSKFNGDISKWNVDKVEDMTYMFECSPLENNPPKWYKG